MIYFVTCPRCMYSFAFELGDRTRVSCPHCLRTFDPFEPLPEKPKPVADSEAIHGKADDLMVNLDDDAAAEPPDLDLTKPDDEASDDLMSEDFDQGL